MLGDVDTWRHVAAYVLGPSPMDGCNPEEDEQYVRIVLFTLFVRGICFKSTTEKENY